MNRAVTMLLSISVLTFLLLVFVVPDFMTYSCDSCPDYYETIVHIYGVVLIGLLPYAWYKVIVRGLKKIGGL